MEKEMNTSVMLKGFIEAKKFTKLLLANAADFLEECFHTFYVH